MNSMDMFQIIGETPESYVLDTANIRDSVTPVHKRSYKLFLLIAAIISLTALLMGSGVAELITMRTQQVHTILHSGEKPAKDPISPDTGPEETVPPTTVFDGEKVQFDQVQDVFLELGSYYPQEIPEGYTMTFVSEGAPLQSQVIHYENGAGGLIQFWIYIGSPASSAEIYGIKDKTEVQVNGQPGILYDQGDGCRALVWLDEKQGFGFVLRVEDASVDILAMAESTAEGEYLVPSRSEKTLEALEGLGDFTPEYLPEGFVEQGVQGSPLSEGSGWYSYVRKWYINRSENTRIYFEYESYHIVTEDGYTDDARTVCSFFIPGYNIRKGVIVGTEIEVNGMFGILTEYDIAWADPESHTVYHLHSKDVVGEELLAVAQSISRVS